MSTVRVNEVELFVEGTGQGKPLLLIHGLGLDHSIWQLQQPAFSPYFRVVSYDVRGHGQSSRSVNYSLVDHARDLAQLMNELGIEKAHIMGLSMGTYICQQFVSLYPERVEKMVLAATKPSGKTSSTQILIEQAQREGKNIDFETVMHIAEKACFREGVGPEAVQIYRTASRFDTLESYMEAMKALTNFDFSPVLPSVRAQTLVINGDEDVLTTLSQARAVHELIPGSKLVVMEHCGHLCNIEQPDVFNREVLAFLRD
ncbi:alpha/beta hydrolase [Alicyclobacillus tolerans]|uniref:alpha/beta fold hydrolase n=1 Tax=Alicyclobacillus tolerans TaxID=90970 RepID=UPI001F2426E6|nr:alpha/beta fold hydrolase [Alicyclobacillus tolerans]MCF8565865.1 alpha/beta hydrolase [Alicyclobacillus tolerans]